VVEHCVDIAGVASSILATPTIQKPAAPLWSRRVFCCLNGSIFPHFTKQTGQYWPYRSNICNLCVI
jgi:hypothetical protein